MTNEAKVDGKKVWYLGNNTDSKDLRIVQPSWNKPFFMTTDFDYAEWYQDHGVYKVILNDSMTTQVLDFGNASDVKKLKWPKVLIAQIQSGKSDLNAVAYEMHCLVENPYEKLQYISDTPEWRKAAAAFLKKAQQPISSVKRSHWQDEPDYKFLLCMWRDIYEAGFSGFTHVEFGHQVLALFSIDAIDKISATKVKHP